MSEEVKDYYKGVSKLSNIRYFNCPCIPCLYFPSSLPSSKLLIYFHGNAEDLGYCSRFLEQLSALLDVSIISIEYPGYGIYNGQPQEKDILEDSEKVINFLIKFGKWKEENIILLGRSIGSGPATHLATKYSIAGLILVSAFTSIKEVAQAHVGILKSILKERFKNIENISKVKCPVFLLHGKKDQIVPYFHSLDLCRKCKSECKIIMPEEMDHNRFNILNDLINPLKEFFTNVHINLKGSEVLYLPLQCFLDPNQTPD